MSWHSSDTEKSVDLYLYLLGFLLKKKKKRKKDDRNGKKFKKLIKGPLNEEN